jgi:hypothetical protein
LAISRAVSARHAFRLRAIWFDAASRSLRTDAIRSRML